jgi:RNA polymerase sigma factor (sigma-70 family)
MASPEIGSPDFWKDGFRVAWRAAFLELGDTYLAEDVAQEALVAAHKHRAQLDPSRAMVWIWVVARNKARDMRDKVCREVVLAELPEVPAPGDVEGSVVREIVVEAALVSLPERLREVVVLRFQEDLAEQDIAQQLGLSYGTVRNRVSEAMKKLQALVGVELEELLD